MSDISRVSTKIEKCVAPDSEWSPGSSRAAVNVLIDYKVFI